MSESTRTDSERTSFLKKYHFKMRLFIFVFFVLCTFYVFPFTHFGECRPTKLIRRLKILKRQTYASQTSRLTYVSQKKKKKLRKTLYYVIFLKLFSRMIVKLK